MFFHVASGYDRSKNPERTWFRYMTIEEAKALRSGSHVQFLDRNDQWRNAKVNGAPKTWKRDPYRVEVPLKYGMYEYFTDKTADFDKRDGFPYRVEYLLVEVCPYCKVSLTNHAPTGDCPDGRTPTAGKGGNDLTAAQSSA